MKRTKPPSASKSQHPVPLSWDKGQPFRLKLEKKPAAKLISKDHETSFVAPSSKANRAHLS